MLASNAYHHRVDSLTAFVALLMIVSSNYLSNAAWLDPVGGLVISLMVVQAGFGNTRSALFELADVAVDGEVKDNVRKHASKALEELPKDLSSGAIEVRSIQGIKAGQIYLMEIELAVPKEWTVSQTRQVEEAVRTKVGAKVRGVKRVRVKFVEQESDIPDFMDEFIPADVSPRSSPEPEEEHNHSHEHSHSHTNGGISKRK